MAKVSKITSRLQNLNSNRTSKSVGSKRNYLVNGSELY